MHCNLLIVLNLGSQAEARIGWAPAAVERLEKCLAAQPRHADCNFWRGEGRYFLVFVQLFEEYGTLLERNTALIENVSPCRAGLDAAWRGRPSAGCPVWLPCLDLHVHSRIGSEILTGCSGRRRSTATGFGRLQCWRLYTSVASPRSGLGTALANLYILF
eukprot:SAG31_NODE_2090_length_6472_cov_4.683352_7_plen_160_part_00